LRLEPRRSLSLSAKSTLPSAALSHRSYVTKCACHSDNMHATQPGSHTAHTYGAQYRREKCNSASVILSQYTCRCTCARPCAARTYRACSFGRPPISRQSRRPARLRRRPRRQQRRGASGGRSLAGLRQPEELRVGRNRKLEPRHERQGGVKREKVNREAGAAVRGGADPARTRREGRVPRDVVGGVRVPRLGSV